MAKHHRKQDTQAHAGPGKPTTPTKAAVASSDNVHNGKLVSEEDIRICAYQKWENAGKPSGDGIQFWLEAEQELVEGKNEEFVQRDGSHGHHEHERLEAEKAARSAM